MTNSKTKISIDAYNKNADRYTSKFEDFSTYKEKIIEFQEGYIPKGANILDLGCGPGNNIKTISELDNTCHFTGIDLSVELISIAKQKFSSYNFLNQDIRYIKSDTKYDVVIASFCIVHLSNTDTADLLYKISEILEKGGSLYLSFMEGNHSKFESTSFSKEQLFFNYYSVTNIIEILNKFDITHNQIIQE
mgnify:CR=1 FL=1